MANIQQQQHKRTSATCRMPIALSGSTQVKSIYGAPLSDMPA